LQRDPFKLTILYLRLWKFCDVVVQKSEKQQSAKFFEIADVDEQALEQELLSFSKSQLDWADNPAKVLDEINDTLALCHKPEKTASDYAVLSSYRNVFQEKALAYSGELTMVSGRSA
jgi:hypothetical protein